MIPAANFHPEAISPHENKSSFFMRTRCLLALGAVIGFALFTPGRVLDASASCDVIPGATQSFRSALGTLDRPFAGPDGLISIKLDRTVTATGVSGCDASSLGFLPISKDEEVVGSPVIIVAFVPDGATPAIVLLSPSCGTHGCPLDGPACRCVEQQTDNEEEVLANMLFLGETELRFRLPDSRTHLSTSDEGIAVSGPARIAVAYIVATASETVEDQLEEITERSCRELVQLGRSELRACVDEIFERDGSCGVRPHAIFSHFTALPRANDYAAMCTEPSPPCRGSGSSSQIRFAIDKEGNALLPVDWRGILVNHDRVPVPRLLRGTSGVRAFPDSTEPIAIPGPAFLGSFSPQGAKLPPIFDPQRESDQAASELTLFGTADAPETVLRIARRQLASACTGGARDGQPCAGAADCPAGGVCLSGARYLACMPSPACATPGGCACVVDADCPCDENTGACVVGRCAPTTCQGGAAGGSDCATDIDCPGGECGPSVFDFGDRRRCGGHGPVVLFGNGSATDVCPGDGACSGDACGTFDLAARDPVPLEGLIAGDTTYGFVLSEAIQGTDRNGDGDELDDVAELVDRMSGQALPIGATSPTLDAGAAASPQCSARTPGRAVARAHMPPFSFPILALDETVSALLEPETGQGAVDTNGNGQIFETILRAFNLGAVNACGEAEPVELRPGENLAVDAAPKIDGESLAIEDGRVYFRIPVESAFDRRTVAISRNIELPEDELPTRRAPAMSRNGRFVAFSGGACDLAPGGCDEDTNGTEDVFFHDRDADEDDILDETTPGATAVQLISRGQDESDDPSNQAAISSDGGSVAFRSLGPELDPADYDREKPWPCRPHPDLNPVDCNGAYDIFVWEQGDAERPVRRLTIDPRDGDDATAASGSPAVSANGRFVAFESLAWNLLSEGDSNDGRSDIFVHDRDADGDTVLDERAAGATRTVRVTLSPLCAPANGESLRPTISADGRFIAFESNAQNLLSVPATDVVQDIFVHDRDADDDGIFDETAADTTKTIQVSVPRFSGPIRGNSSQAALSADGRVVAFTSTDPNLVAGDDSGSDVFVHDRDPDENGIFDEPGHVSTDNVSRSISGGLGNGPSDEPSISADGRFIAFSSTATNLVPDDPADDDPPNPGKDVFLHDRVTAITTLVSKRAGGTAANGSSSLPAMSGDGRFVAFHSLATNLATTPPGVSDPSLGPDVIVRGPGSDPLQGLLAGQDVDAHLLATLSPGPQSGQPGSITLLCPASEASSTTSGVAFLADPSHCPGTVPNPEPPASVVHLWVPGDAEVRNLELHATRIVSSTTWIAALADEGPTGEGKDMNGDGDQRDTVLAVREIGGAEWGDTGQAAVKIAIRGSIIAFLTPEAAQGQGSLNADPDTTDLVLQVVDAGVPEVRRLGFGGVTPSRSARDFVVGGSLKKPIVAFHTAESDEDAYLNGDNDRSDTVLVVYDDYTGQRIDTGMAVTPCGLEACDPRVPYRVDRDTVTFLTYESDQNHTDLNGDGDADDLVLQILNVRVAAAQLQSSATTASASVGAGGSIGSVSAAAAAGATTALAAVDTAGCPPGDQQCAAERSASFAVALADLGPGKVLSSRGRCVLKPNPQSGCSMSSCPVGQVCGPDHFCRFEEGVCNFVEGDERQECPSGFECVDELTTVTAADGDEDELPDLIDNCPTRKNITQVDGNDDDGVGKACESRCGNGIVEPGEACDGGRGATCCTESCQIDLCAPCGRCDASTGSCVARVLDSCRTPTQAAVSQLLIQDTKPDSLDMLTWLWRSGEATPAADYGYPLAGNGYQFCLFQGAGPTASIVYGGRVAPGASWKALGRNPSGKRGYRYRNVVENESGLWFLRLKPGAEGAAAITLKGRGENLMFSGPATAPLRAQLLSNEGQCWEECFSSSPSPSQTGLVFAGGGGCP